MQQRSIICLLRMQQLKNSIASIVAVISMVIICCLQIHVNFRWECLQRWNSWESWGDFTKLLFIWMLVAMVCKQNPCCHWPELTSWSNLALSNRIPNIDHISNSSIRALKLCSAALSFPAQNNLCRVPITRVDPGLNCRAHNNPVSLRLTQASCLSNYDISWLFSPWLRQGGKKWYKRDRQGWWLSLVLSFHVVTLRLNSVGSTSINKVFRRSAVCSPFPSLSECLSVCVCSASSECCLGVETPLEFLHKRCQKFIQDYFNDTFAITDMHHRLKCYFFLNIQQTRSESRDPV